MCATARRRPARSGAAVENRGHAGVCVEGPDLSGLWVRPCRCDRLAAVVRDDDAADADGLSFDDLLERDLVGLEGGSRLTRLLEAKAASLMRPMALHAQVRSFEAVCRAARASAWERHVIIVSVCISRIEWFTARSDQRDRPALCMRGSVGVTAWVRTQLTKLSTSGRCAWRSGYTRKCACTGRYSPASKTGRNFPLRM